MKYELDTLFELSNQTYNPEISRKISTEIIRVAKTLLADIKWH